ncbi:MAG TPA: hypothetical protein VHG89_09510 [Verrucomicrobiae bacterium]|nr:hypothetical protein [Verrucomicrobiae bacterium]
MKHEKYPAASGKSRGKGLMPGIEMVKDRVTKVPASAAHVHPSGRRGFSARSSG